MYAVLSFLLNWFYYYSTPDVSQFLELVYVLFEGLRNQEIFHCIGSSFY